MLSLSIISSVVSALRALFFFSFLHVRLACKHLNDRAASLQEKYSPNTLNIISCMVLFSSLRHLHCYTYMLIHVLLGKLAAILMMIIMLQDYLHLLIRGNGPRIGQREMIWKISITLELVASIRMNTPDIGSYFICLKNIPSWHWPALESKHVIPTALSF